MQEFIVFSISRLLKIEHLHVIGFGTHNKQSQDNALAFKQIGMVILQQTFLFYKLND